VVTVHCSAFGQPGSVKRTPSRISSRCTRKRPTRSRSRHAHLVAEHSLTEAHQRGKSQIDNRRCNSRHPCGQRQSREFHQAIPNSRKNAHGRNLRVTVKITHAGDIHLHPTLMQQRVQRCAIHKLTASATVIGIEAVGIATTAGTLFQVQAQRETPC